MILIIKSCIIKHEIDESFNAYSIYCIKLLHIYLIFIFNLLHKFICFDKILSFLFQKKEQPPTEVRLLVKGNL